MQLSHASARSTSNAASLHNEQSRRLRFVFNDSHLSVALAADATLEDIALTVDRISTQGYGRPVAVYVTLPGSASPGSTGMLRQTPASRSAETQPHGNIYRPITMPANLPAATGRKWPSAK
jgi:hypothetical protein